MARALTVMEAVTEATVTRNYDRSSDVNREIFKLQKGIYFSACKLKKWQNGKRSLIRMTLIQMMKMIKRLGRENQRAQRREGLARKGKGTGLGNNHRPKKTQRKMPVHL